MTATPDANAILHGGVDLGRAFLTFAARTEQKLSHGLLFAALLRALQRRNVVLRDGCATNLVD